ncbi:hypothetical protein [Corynebacterium dentalis]|uniref:hypothetical protein n=1 Tax=Corynebacterium dentalis TaxID=2014528 RepID=UPI00370DB0BC
MNQHFNHTYGPYGQTPMNPPAPQSGIKRWHLIATAVTAFILGIVAMIAFAFLVDDPTPSDDATVGGGSNAAVRYLEKQGIMIEPETYDKIADVLCAGMANGSTGDTLKSEVTASIGTGDFDSSEIVAASAVFTCPEHIGKLVR